MILKRLTLVSLLVIGLCSATIYKKNKRVFDNENILTTSQIDSLTTLYLKHEEETTNQVVLITTPSFSPYSNITEFATETGNKMGIGQKDLDNGVLIVYSNKLRQVRIATGYGIQQILTDSIAKQVIQEKMIPEFKKDRPFKGLYAGSEWIINFLANTD